MQTVDPDQTPRSAASDLDLHCLQMSLYGTLGINGSTVTINEKQPKTVNHEM